MILVDTDAENKLVQALKQPLPLSGELGGISFRFTRETISPERLCAVLPELLQNQLDHPDCKIFFCEAGDVFLLSPGLHPRLAHKIALSVAKALDVSALECEFGFYDLSRDAGRLLALLEPRMAEKERARSEAQAQQQAREQSARLAAVRQSILDAELSDELKNGLRERRRERQSLEIMMIEDDPFSRRMAANILSRDYHLTALESAESALSTYARIAPDILFLDINLPNVTGHELLERLLVLDPDAYIVMLSGNADRDNVLQAMQRGAKGFVAKPFTPDKLYQYIKRCPTFSDRRNHAYH